MRIKALAMLSGGLDSTLAVKLMMELGIDLEAIYFYTIFCTCNRASNGCGFHSQRVAKEFGIPLKVMNISEEYLAVVKSPKYGYGSHLNPCIDCRIFTFRKAREYMSEIGAGFLVTGEVLGERPMSQKLCVFRIIEKETGLEGLILRPLSARLLEPSIPEKEGWVDRERLLAIQGRSRKPQIKLAEELGVADYPCPAGGCLLTDPIFSKKIKDLIEHDELSLDNLNFLKLGRYFRLTEKVKLVVGRNEDENNRIINSARPEDLIFQVVESPGPTALARGQEADNLTQEICQKVASYADDADHGQIKIALRRHSPPVDEIYVIKCQVESSK
jgi:tRNA U34 2-thiouridine synthase MnmA/TrmU